MILAALAYDISRLSKNVAIIRHQLHYSSQNLLREGLVFFTVANVCKKMLPSVKNKQVTNFY